ncbi:MAG: MarR family transcriptional regulator [Paludibacter sp.]|nr:MarR family transcriptional regulator [Paludibacter sp.]
MEYEQLKLENQLCFPLYAVSRLITRAYQEDLDALGITYPQYLVLMVLWEKDSQTVNDIAHKLILNTNTITPLLKRMEVAELILRKQSETDHRKIIINLTDQGETLREKAAEIPFRLMRKMKIEQSPTKMEGLMNLKKQLNELILILEHIEK